VVALIDPVFADLPGGMGQLPGAGMRESGNGAPVASPGDTPENAYQAESKVPTTMPPRRCATVGLWENAGMGVYRGKVEAVAAADAAGLRFAADVRIGV